MTELYAHTPNEEGKWHYLKDHLQKVAELARSFAEKFGAGDLAFWAGLWHDLGKANPEFQSYLHKCINEPDKLHRGPDHKGAGAVLAYKHLEPLAFPTAGHHGGLMNYSDLKSWLSGKNDSSHIQNMLHELANHGFNLSPSTLLTPPFFIKDDVDAEFFIRMLFSALVDADFLDTEDHFNPDNKAKRGNFPSLLDLWQCFENDQNKITGKSDDQLNIIRNDVYLDCIKAAELPPGFFRLTVPTGGGKTRSSMAFGLRHAIAHGMYRVIFAIPYTSIIEQTADVYRDIFGKEAVLEHHSAVTYYDDELDNIDDGTSWARLASQNWNTPIIVTTTVQLFESLLSNKTSKCRKLHNIANSVIILDEVQTLPTKLLAPILDVQRQLVDHYGVTVVFCTATQPALEDSPYLKGIKNIREIVKKPANLFGAMKRVDYQKPRKDEKWDWQRVAEEMRQSLQCLAIVNTKDDAMSLLSAIDDPSALHLSTLLCGAHRRDVLGKIRKLLNEGKPCRLVSTQVVEAGVDLDFPLVLRAIGPLDRIVQAAGRCNRNGKMEERGRVVVFNPVDAKTLKNDDYQTGIETAFSLINLEGFDFHNPKIYETYFKRLYQVVNTDAKRIQESRENLNYKDVDDKFKIIDDASISVIVRYKGLDNENSEVDKILSSIKYMPPSIAFRKLQPYLVNIKQYKFRQFQLDGLIIEIADGRYEWCGAYDNVRGLMATGRNPEDFVV